jgi:hypothetical protein
MKSFSVSIMGTSSLLQHRFGEQAEGDGGEPTRRVHIERGSPREEAEKASYRDKEKNLYLPGSAILRLLREAGGGHKQKGSRKSLKHVIPAAVRVLEDAIPLYKPGTQEKLADFEVDSRPVTIPATKGRIMRHRPRLDEWEARFTLKVNEKMMDEETVHMLLTEGGESLGVGDYRPERGGPFGCFRVVTWAPLEQPTNGSEKESRRKPARV